MGYSMRLGNLLDNLEWVTCVQVVDMNYIRK